MSNSVPETSNTPSPRRMPAALWMLLAIAATLAALFAWTTWSRHRLSAEPSVDIGPEALDARLLQVEAAVQSLRRGQDSLNQKVTDTRARTGLLRDEVLAVTQRASLLEDNVRQSVTARGDGVAALRLDEVELLLTLAQQRLRLSGDLAGAVRATELAQGVLASQRDPALLDLRQSLDQELAALRALPQHPIAFAAGELDALQAALPRLESGASLSAGKTERAPADGLQRLLASLVQVRRSGGQDLLSPADRSAGQTALMLEITLAQSALANVDQVAFRRALSRIDAWLQRLYTDAPALRDRRARLARLAALDLQYKLPIAGSTLQQLQGLLQSRRSAR